MLTWKSKNPIEQHLKKIKKRILNTEYRIPITAY